MGGQGICNRACIKCGSAGLAGIAQNAVIARSAADDSTRRLRFRRVGVVSLPEFGGGAGAGVGVGFGVLQVLCKVGLSRSASSDAPQMRLKAAHRNSAVRADRTLAR